MRLWEKNYVLTMTIILLVLYGSMLFVLNYSFRFNLERVCEQGMQTEQSILYSVKSLLNEDGEHKKLKLYSEVLEKQGIFFAVYKGQEAVTDSLPVFEAPSLSEGKVQMLRAVDGRYLCFADTFMYQDIEKVSVYYAEKVDDLYKNHQKQSYLLLVISTFISLIIAAILYFAMKKIYYPINNIAHELRTPLTSIQGYAQYILFGKVSEEDIQYACARINEETGYINEVIERLLVMEHIKDGKISLEKIDAVAFFEKVKTHNPSVIIDNTMDTIMGDETLLLCLFMNLLSNTRRAGEKITITAHGSEINICNEDDYIDKAMLRLLNGNRAIPKDRIQGKGLGVSLCHEIVKLHRGILRYESQEGEGVRITIIFPD